MSDVTPKPGKDAGVRLTPEERHALLSWVPLAQGRDDDALVAFVEILLTRHSAEAWEVGNNTGLTFAAAPQKSLLINPYTGKVGRWNGAPADPVSRFVAREKALHEAGCDYPDSECTCVTSPGGQSDE